MCISFRNSDRRLNRDNILCVRLEAWIFLIFCCWNLFFVQICGIGQYSINIIVFAARTNVINGRAIDGHWMFFDRNGFMLKTGFNISPADTFQNPMQWKTRKATSDCSLIWNVLTIDKVFVRQVGWFEVCGHSSPYSLYLY